MESNLVSEFVQQTGCDTETAYSLLQAKHWDFTEALQAWEYVTSLPEHSPLSASSEAIVAAGRAARGALQKASAIDLPECKKLTRGISRATDNVNLVNRARNEIALDFQENPCFKVNRYFIETPEYTFTLPDLTIYGDDFRIFLEKDLIEKSTLTSLEQSGRLNWWADCGTCQRLWPLSTTGDGNCLLHAASLAMWGFHDRLLTLRKALYAFLKESNCRNALYRRWRWQQTRINAQSGFVYSEEEWQTEWETIVNMASTEPRKVQNGRRISSAFLDSDLSVGATYESLEEIHVLALAHVLKRPIIVIADLMLKDMNGEPIAPIPFGGIYLPLESDPSECHHSPLLLTYDMAHFSALVVMEKESVSEKLIMPPAAIPLIDVEGCLLPLQFSIDPGENFLWGKEDSDQHVINRLILSEKQQIILLKEYLDVVEISTAATPSEDDGLDSEEEIDKRFAEVVDVTGDDNSESNIFGNNRSRAAKQLQSVAKQFGSIGKSMGKKLKGTITKMTKPTTIQKKSLTSSNFGSNSSRGTRLLCSQLHTKRHEYQEQMVRNYLQCAQSRFLREMQSKNRSEESLKLHEQALAEGPLKCINPDCDNFGTVLTSYMCQKCFETQRSKEMSHSQTNLNSPNISQARYGTGKSKFYRDSDIESHNTIKRLPSTKPCMITDQTLYLSKSTFYNDTGLPPISSSSLSDISYCHETSPPVVRKHKIIMQSDSLSKLTDVPESVINHCDSKPNLDEIDSYRLNVGRAVNNHNGNSINSLKQFDTFSNDMKNKSTRPTNIANTKKATDVNPRANSVITRNNSGEIRPSDVNVKKKSFSELNSRANSGSSFFGSSVSDELGNISPDYVDALSNCIDDNKKTGVIDYHRSSMFIEPKTLPANRIQGYNIITNISTNDTPSNTFSSSKFNSTIALNSQQSFDMPDIERVNGLRACRENGAGIPGKLSPFGSAQPCRTNNCKFFGNVETDFYCSKCSKQRRCTGTLI